MSEGFVVSDDESGGTSLAARNASNKLRGLPAITADLLVPTNCRAVIIARTRMMKSRPVAA